MTMKDRFGGLFSPLNRRDLLSIDAIEFGMVADPPSGTDIEENEAEVWLEENVHFSTSSQDRSLQEIEDHLEYVRDWFKEIITSWYHTGELRHSAGKGRVRGYIADIDKVLAKVKRAIRKLDSESLD